MQKNEKPSPRPSPIRLAAAKRFGEAGWERENFFQRWKDSPIIERSNAFLNAELPPCYSGFVNGGTSASLSTAVTLSTTASASSPVGTYAISASGAVGGNYAITHVAGVLTVTQSFTSGALASSANPSLPATDVTFIMTLSAVAPGAGTPGGSVDFVIDGGIAGSSTLSGGVATFTVRDFPTWTSPRIVRRTQRRSASVPAGT